MTGHLITKRYLVCTTPRTGSGYLCDTLWRTGLLGYPDEFFCEGGFHPDYLCDGKRGDFGKYFLKVSRLSSTANGVSGIKVMWQDFRGLLDAHRHHGSPDAGDDRSILDHLFPGTSFIWLTRRNRHLQAASLYRRRITGVHHVRGGERAAIHAPAPPALELEEIVRWLQTQDGCWKRFFDDNGVAPLHFTYEEVDNCIEIVVRTIARYLDVTLPATLPLARSDYRRLSVETAGWRTDDWQRRG